MKREWFWRFGIYLVGVAFAAVGTGVGTKTGMGISPVNAIPFAFSRAFEVELSTAVFCFLTLMTALQFLIRGKQYRWMDLLQIPFSIVFSALIGLFDGILQVPEPLWQKFCMLGASILMLGIGVTLMVNMRIAPNPADGLADTIGWALGRDMGFGKNIADICFVIIAFLVDILFGTLWCSIGLTTVISSIFLGRFIALFNHILRERILHLAGLEAPPGRNQPKLTPERMEHV